MKPFVMQGFACCVCGSFFGRLRFWLVGWFCSGCENGELRIDENV